MAIPPNLRLTYFFAFRAPPEASLDGGRRREPQEPRLRARVVTIHGGVPRPFKRGHDFAVHFRECE